MSRAAPRPLTVALESLTESLAPVTTLARVQKVWEQATGPAIASAAQPVSEREGVLTVSCEASVWAQELELMAPELLRALNAALGAELLQALRCRTG
jgi:predicted nucleic acid-binding Zn ribbon protein